MISHRNRLDAAGFHAQGIYGSALDHVVSVSGLGAAGLLENNNVLLSAFGSRHEAG